MAEPPKLELTLRDNAYSFLNEALDRSLIAQNHPEAWKFTTLHIVQAIELLLKERLRMEHPSLLFENVDSRKRTVTLEGALIRLEALGIALDGYDKKVINRAVTWRNSMMHHEFSLFVHEARANFVLLFEWAHKFHLEHLGGELHDVIREDLWVAEAELISEFREQFVTYRGAGMVREWPLEIMYSQFERVLVIDGQEYERIPYGEENWFDIELPPYCGDCAVLPGELHGSLCDIERCPRCDGQLLSCQCLADIVGVGYEDVEAPSDMSSP